MLRPFSTRLVRCGLVVAALGASAGPVLPARAQELAERAEAASERVALRLVVESSDPTISARVLSPVIEEELDVSVGPAEQPGALGTITVRLNAPTTLVVVYAGADGKTIRREIESPAHPEQRPLVVALLVGNLVRTEADTLLAELQAERARVREAEEAERRAAEARAGAATREETPAAEKKAPPEKSTKPEPERAASSRDAAPPPPLERRVANAAFFHPLAVYRDAERYRFHLELGLVYGRVGSVDGAALDVILGRVEQDVEGAAIAGVVSLVGTDQRGLGVAGIAQLVGGEVFGAQATGIFSVAGRVRGLQLAGITNWSRGPVRGIQFSGLTNVRTAETPSERFVGAQITGGVNVDRGSFSGLQLGLVNVGHRVSGVQIGLVNVAGDLDGASIAPIAFSGNGRTQLVAWASNAFLANAGVKFLTGPLYTLPHVGVTPGDGGSVVRSGIALGGHVPFGSFYADIDIGISHEASLDGVGTNDQTAVRYRGILGWEPTRAVGLFGGVALRQRLPLNGFEPEYAPEGLGGVTFF